MLARSAQIMLRYLPFGLLCFILFFLVILPIAIIVYASFLNQPPRPGSVGGEFVLDHYQALMSAANQSALKNSLIIGIGGTAGAVLIGGLLAWISARTNTPGKILVQIAGIAPMFMSSLVTALAWSILGSPSRGYLNIIFEALGLPLAINIYSLGGIIFVMALSYTPYVYLLTNSALMLLNPEFEDAASIHGANRWKMLRLVTLPMIAPALIGATLLTFVLVIENFTVPAILGSAASPRIQTIPAFLFRLMNHAPARANEAAAVGVMLTTATVVLVWIQRAYLRRRSYITVTGKGFRPREIHLGPFRWIAAAAVVLYVSLAVILPYLALLKTALSGLQFIRTPADLFRPSSLDFQRFVDLITNDAVQLAMSNSIIAAAGCALLGGALHFVMAYYVHRTKAVGRSLLEYFAMLPLAIPGLVLGMGFLWTWFLLPLPLYGTLLLLILAFSVKFMPQGFRGISSTIGQVHPDLEDSAVLSGASRIRSVWTITVPLIRTGLISTALLLTILSMRELSSVIFLFTSDTRILSIVIFDYWEVGSVARAAGVSLLYTALLLVLAVTARRWFGLRQ